MHEVDRARAALHALDSGCPRDEWVSLAMAAKAAGLDFDDFHEWSRPAHNYRNEADCASVWRSIAESGGIGAGTLFAKAREAGWSEPVNGHRPRQRPQEPRKPGGKADGPSFDFAAVWRDSEAATAQHPYIARKLGLPDGLRVYRGPLTLNGQALDGSLLVPAFDADGNLQSWQAIPPAGDKRNAPGATIRGASFSVGGAVHDGEPVYLCEGIGQAWSAHQATGKPAVVCFGAGNVETIARRMRERYPVTRIVIVCDAGKERDGERIARAVGGAWVEMPAGSAANFDLNDYHQQVRSLPAVAELLAQAREPEPADDDRDDDRPREINIAALAERVPEPPAFIVPDWLPAGEVTLLAANGGTGKSATALRLAVCLCTGRDFHGLPVAQRSVDFVSFEDAEPVIHWRLHRICRALGVAPADVADGLRIFDGTKCVSAWYSRGQFGETGPTAAFHAMAERIGGPGRVVIVDGSNDTFAANENDRAQVKAFTRMLRRLIAADGALLLLAHVDKLAAKSGAESLGFSGSTGWNNGVRCRWYMYVETDDEGIESGRIALEVRKSNLGRTGARMLLAFDEASGTFERVDTETPQRGRAFQRADEADAILQIIRAAWAAGDPIPAATGGTRTAHSVCEARGELPATLKGRRGRQRFNRALEELRAAGAVRTSTVRTGSRNTREVLYAPD